ncbi:MAG: metal ABC transporter ATP-binding protein [Oscillospiraceae bacterium]|jgi:zinc transport system ATP-binding protein|nr:metal ABC transporter ATP-binding protein [Oscillospiraceae bacterium]
MALITLDQCAFGYEGVPVAQGLTFQVQRGDYLCIVGENGSGKSTLIKGLLRLQQPLTGTFAMGEGLRADEIGYLPQQTAAQKDFPASVREVVLSGCLARRGLRPFYSRENRRAADENMERLGIAHLRKRCYRELSGGQQQRALLARALCATQKLLLLDEPVSGLDPVATQELYALIADINRELGVTVLMVSHDIHAAVRYASHILHLKSRQVFFGAKADYVTSEAGRLFLGGESE